MSLEVKHKKGKELIEWERVEDTPFTIGSDLKTDPAEHHVLMGTFRMNEKPLESKEEAREFAKTVTWNKILKVVFVMLEKHNEFKNDLKDENNE